MNTTGLLAMLAAETFIQFSAIQGISFSSMPRSESLTSRSRFFRRVLIFGARSSAVIPPNILAISLVGCFDDNWCQSCEIFDVYASMQWHSASNPTAASTCFGMVFMQSGSTMDTFATMALHLSDFLSPFSGLVRTANPFPSEPVPQVVGISTSGSAVSLTQAKIQPQPDIRRKGNGEHRKLGIHIRGYIHIHILERRGTCGLILNTGRYIFEEDITDEIVRLCHLYSFPLFTMPWDTRIFDITHDYYNRIFEDSRDDGNMTAAFQNILMGNSLTDEQADTIKGSGFNNGCYNVLSIGTEATDEFMYILQKVCNNTDLVFHAFVYDGNPTVILR